jgi:CDP-glucose 4,6-dehydratase
VRAGNVFGGGDWAADRLVPDIVRATLAGNPAFIRNPASVRPWQHVLEPLAGYLLVLAALLEGDASAAEAWNFGPSPADCVDVAALAGMISAAWSADRNGSGPRFRFGAPDASAPPEAVMLALDSAKARAKLGWQPRLDLPDAIALTVAWYRRWAAGDTDMAAYTLHQIEDYSMPGRRAADAADTADTADTGDLQQCA